MQVSITDPKAVAEQGEKLYRDKFRAQYEPARNGWFLAIEVATGDAFLGKDPEAAYEAAKAAAPHGMFHLIRIGSPGAFRVRYSSDGGRNRLLR